MLTFPTNASTKYSPNTKANSKKLLLPATLDLEGTWEVAIVNIHPFNWPELESNLLLSLFQRRKARPRRKSRKRNRQEERPHYIILKPDADSLVSNTHWIPTPKSGMIMGMSMQNKFDRNFPGTILMKIPTGYYDSHASLGKYLENEFAMNLPIKDHEELSACQIHSFSDNVTLKISLSTNNIVDFRIFPLKERFNAHNRAICTQCDNKIFITVRNCFGNRMAFLHKYRTKYIYWESVKYQIMRDTQDPLLVTLQFKGSQMSNTFGV